MFARIVRRLARCASETILARRELKSPMTCPMYSSGTTTSMSMMGSSMTGEPLRRPSLNAYEAAIWNAISDESTSWYDPSTRITFTSVTGYPASTPLFADAKTPFLTAGINSRGMAPLLILSTNVIPAPGVSCGSISKTTCPYWPRPPDCAMCLPTTLIFFVSVSRYATSGWPTLASTLNSLRMRSMMISRCSCPMPAIRVCPVS